jgi:hypothetical protein
MLPALVAGHHHHPHAAHLRGGRVGAVGRLRDQADIALAVATADRGSCGWPQAGVFALRAGVGLHADGVETGNLASRLFQFADHLLVALGLLGGANGCMLANSGQVIGIISLVAFSFMVQEPSGIIDVVQRDRSLFSRRFR